MATYYSNNFSSLTGASATAAVAGYTTNVGEVGARLRSKRMEFAASAAITTSDVVRMGQFRSSDRFIALYLSSADMGTTGDINVGLYLAGGDAHDGAVVDADLFGSAIDINAAAISFTEILGESGTITSAYRGKTLWEMAAAGAASYTEDPGVTFDLTIAPSENTTATTGSITLFAFYTAGD